MYIMKYGCLKTPGSGGQTAAHHACIPQEPLTARLAGTAAQAIPIPGCRKLRWIHRIQGGLLVFSFLPNSVCYQQPVVEGDGLTPSLPTRTPLEGPVAHKVHVS